MARRRSFRRIKVLALRIPGVALQARRDLTPVDAEGRERFESASAAAALLRHFATSPAPLARFFVLVVAAALSLMRLCILSFVSWGIFLKMPICCFFTAVRRCTT